jgi:hypothetical protein
MTITSLKLKNRRRQFLISQAQSPLDAPDAPPELTPTERVAPVSDFQMLDREEDLALALSRRWQNPFDSY